MTVQNKLGGTFTFPGTSMTVNRMGYGAMQLAGKGGFGPPMRYMLFRSRICTESIAR